MKKLYFISSVLLVLITITCQAQSPTNNDNPLNKCLNSGEITQLNQLVDHFEEYILARYDTNLTQAYKQYLDELTRLHLDTPSLYTPTGAFNGDGYKEYISAIGELFKDPQFKQDVQIIEKSTVFKSIWIHSSSFNENKNDTTYVDENGEVQRDEQIGFDPMMIYPDGAYIKCMVSLNKDDRIAHYLDAIVNNDEDSIKNIGLELPNQLTVRDLENKLIRLIVVVHLYYDFGMQWTNLMSLFR